ncbi:eclosion hormone [Photinus pyralis]|uniref:eclosion hormone n=1 Tax=Photinus pyralis TaxID=7054 RepID=UPI0012676501|nr:eclosion hormone [Photinus pyralis]
MTNKDVGPGYNRLYGVLYVLVLLWKVPAMGHCSFDICITNCVQCKKMFGPYFQGRVCADACVSTNGKIILDCNIPETVVTFLKRFH